MDKHTAIYARVSSATQDTRSQLADLKRWAANHDGPVVWYEDRASGATMDRPGWVRLWTAVVSGAVDRLVCWRLDRLGRTSLGLAQLFEDLPRHGVDLVSLRDGVVGLDTPAGRMLATIIASVSQYEREVKRERQTAGIAAAKAAGKTWGGATNTGKRLHVTPEQEAMIRRMAAETHGMGVPRWTKAAIARATGLSRPTVYSVLAAAAPG